MRNKTFKARCGVSLTELLVVMSACSVVLTMSAGVVHRVMRIQSATRYFFDVERSALRLANQFRHDVHRAGAAIVGGPDLGDGVVSRLTLSDDQTVEYGRAASSVLRTVTQRGKIVARDEFSFRSDIELAIREEDSPRRLVLSLASVPQTDSGGEKPQRFNPYTMPVNLQVEACLGRDRSFTDVATVQEQSE